METKKLAFLSLMALASSAVCLAVTQPDPRFAHKEHLSAVQLYQMGLPWNAIKDNVGQFVTLDVVVQLDLTTGRSAPLVEIVIPQELRNEKTPVRRSYSAHLEGAILTSQGSGKAIKQTLRASSSTRVMVPISSTCTRSGSIRNKQPISGSCCCAKCRCKKRG